MTTENDNSTQEASSSAAPGSAFALVRLTDLRITKCADKDALSDAMRAYNQCQIASIPLRWHVGAQTWVELEVCE